MVIYIYIYTALNGSPIIDSLLYGGSTQPKPILPQAAAFGARPNSILETLTTAPAEQTGASKEVIEAAGKWQAVCEEKGLYL